VNLPRPNVQASTPPAPRPQSAAPKVVAVKPPQTSQPMRPAAGALQAKPLNARQSPPVAPRPPFNPSARPPLPQHAARPFANANAARPALTLRPPAVAQPSMLTGQSRRVVRPPQTAAGRGNTSPTPAGLQAVGVVQLAKTKSKATITKGHLNKPIKDIKKIHATRDPEKRISNVRAPVRKGNKKGRKSTTKHKTTDTSKLLNNFLRSAGLHTAITRIEGGHCVADVFGGSLCLSNTIPLPHAFNTIAYKKEETSLKNDLSPTTSTTMEVSVEYPDNPLEGFLTTTEQNKLKKQVSDTQYEKLEGLFSKVPDFIAWEVNNTTTGGHDWWEFRDIRKDFWPRGTKPDGIISTTFVNAVNNL
jgi:hypothetical protein